MGRNELQSRTMLSSSFSASSCFVLMTLCLITAVECLLHIPLCMKSCDLRHQLLLRQNKFFNISIGRKGKTIRTFMTATDQKGRSIAKTKSTPNGDNPVVIQHVEFSCESNTGNQHAPVILLHGLLGSKRNFSTLGTSLSKQLKKPRRVLAVDLRNHGKPQKFYVCDTTCHCSIQ